MVMVVGLAWTEDGQIAAWSLEVDAVVDGMEGHE